jgi:hypothetical protein
MFLKPERTLERAAPMQYHVIDADTVDDAIADFLRHHDATLVGDPQKFPGLQAIATARANGVVFTIHFVPSSDAIPGFS